MRRAAPIRMRPVLMTAISMIFGVLPAALGVGPGAETRAPMAVAPRRGHVLLDAAHAARRARLLPGARRRGRVAARPPAPPRSPRGGPASAAAERSGVGQGPRTIWPHCIVQWGNDRGFVQAAGRGQHARVQAPLSRSIAGTAFALACAHGRSRLRARHHRASSRSRVGLRPRLRPALGGRREPRLWLGAVAWRCCSPPTSSTRCSAPSGSRGMP